MDDKWGYPYFRKPPHWARFDRKTHQDEVCPLRHRLSKSPEDSWVGYPETNGALWMGNMIINHGILIDVAIIWINYHIVIINMNNSIHNKIPKFLSLRHIWFLIIGFYSPGSPGIRPSRNSLRRLSGWTEGSAKWIATASPNATIVVKITWFCAAIYFFSEPGVVYGHVGFHHAFWTWFLI